MKSSTMKSCFSRRSLMGGVAVSTLAALPLATRLSAMAAPDSDRHVAASLQATPAESSGPYELPPLPYDVAALEPAIDAETMQIHHDRHHQAYVDNLNKAVAGLTDVVDLSAEELIQQLDLVPEEQRTAVRNNGGGHVNHTMFWEIMVPGGSEPGGALLDAVVSAFGDVTALQEAVNTAGLGRFGSGWAWVVVNQGGDLEVTSTPNQDNPLMTGIVDVPGYPILGVDVWEHAYYLQYQNKRADYLAAWWSVVNWDVVSERYDRALGEG